MEVKTIDKGYYDVVVVGGGIAGVSASVSASRLGAKVLLIEKQINLGGLATGGLISWYEPLCNGKGEQIIGGIAQELIKLSVKYSYDSLPKAYGGTDKSFPRTDRYGDRYATKFSPCVFSLALDEFVISNGVDVLFDTYATYPVMENNSVVGVIVENIDGRCLFHTQKIIDATGNALIMQRAGVPCRTGKNYMTYLVHSIDEEVIKEYNNDKCAWKLRKWEAVGADRLGKGQPQGMGTFENPTARDVTDFITEGKRRMLEKLKARDRYSYEVMSIPTMPQLRTIRQIVGDADFNGITDETYTDSIGMVSDFRAGKEGSVYQIPKGALYNSQFKGLYAAGRIISAPTHDGWEVSRVIPVCAFTGETAGKLAVLGANN